VFDQALCAGENGFFGGAGLPAEDAFGFFVGDLAFAVPDPV
jgi:hypothetical protein